MSEIKKRSISLKTTKTCLKEMARVYNMLKREEISAYLAKNLTYILNSMVRGYTISDLEERLIKLEEIINEKQNN
jgi:hypothetical protein